MLVLHRWQGIVSSCFAGHARTLITLDVRCFR